MRWKDEAGPMEDGDADGWNQDRLRDRQGENRSGPTERKALKSNRQTSTPTQRGRVRGRGDAEIVRWDRVFRIRAELASGQYRISDAAVADSLLRDEGTATQILPWMYSAKE